MYKLINDSMIVRESDGAVIPTDTRNTDYQEYLNWKAVGNTAVVCETLLGTQETAARTYLSQTDWYVIRFMETGVAIPEDITLKRKQARESIQ